MSNPVGAASLDNPQAEHYASIREAVRAVCQHYGSQYWRQLDVNGAYPREFVDALAGGGWLSILIPEAFGGGGGGLRDACVVLEEIHRSGANANACHAQMYTMGILLRHGNDSQKKAYLPKIAAGELRLQAFGVTEPDSGSDTTRIRTNAVLRGDKYIVNGQKTFTSRIADSDLMLLLVRSAPREQQPAVRTEGLSVLLVDLREDGGSVHFERIPLMFNHHSYQVYITNLEVPAENLIGEEGKGFSYIIDGWNAERILVSSEAIGDARFFIDRASRYANERVVFGRPIGANQGIQFPIAQAYADTEAASLMRWAAATKFDCGSSCGPEANMAKLLASRASWAAANAAVTTFGGNAFAKEYDIERKLRETKLLEIAPISNNLILAYIAQRVLLLPRSY